MVSLKACIATALVAHVSAHPFHAISAFYKQNRFTGAALTCTIKGCSADLIAQYIASKDQTVCEESLMDNALFFLNPLLERGGAVEEKKKFSIDLKRSAVFLLYGALYQGCFHEFLYNSVYPYLLGTGTDVKTAVKKVAVDMGIMSPLLCIPMAYVVKGCLVRRSLRESYADYWGDVMNKGLLLKLWTIFIPVQILNFSVIPQHFRLSFIACFSFFWTILMSLCMNSTT